MANKYLASSEPLLSDPPLRTVQNEKGISETLTLIGLALNALLLIATVGAMYYFKIAFKRAPITETTEREALSVAMEAPSAPSKRVLVPLESITVNIATSPDQPPPADNATQQIQGKLHYITTSVTLELRDKGEEGMMETAKPLIQDKLIHILGKKHFHELTSIQGRYTLSSQIIDAANQIVSNLSITPVREALITNVYFTEFIVQ